MENILYERVKEVMEYYEYSPTAFADAIDVPRPIVSHILSGRNKPSLDVVQKIILRFPELNPLWLLTGKGEMRQLNLFTSEELESVSTEKPIDLSINAGLHKNTFSTPKEAATQKIALENETVHEPKPIDPIPTQTPQPIQALNLSALPTTPKPDTTFPIQGQKQVERIMVFYTDKTFSIYHPE
jgi:hypothetical protein